MTDLSDELAAKRAAITPWFEQRRNGVGVGRPITWQGWALLISVPFAFLLPWSWLPFLSPGKLGTSQIAGFLILAIATPAQFIWLIPLLEARTKGGWTWR